MHSAGLQPTAQPYHYLVRDTEQKGLCLHNGRLVATSLQGANAVQEGRCPVWGRGGTPTHGCSHPPHPPPLLIEPISVVPNKHLERRRCPLIVGIRGGTQALSCGTGPEPQLKLEVSGGGVCVSRWGVSQGGVHPGVGHPEMRHPKVGQLKMGNTKWGHPGVVGTPRWVNARWTA